MQVPRPKPPVRQVQVSVQVPEPWAGRLDRIAEKMSAAAGGVPVRRADVLRVVIQKGMDAVEAGVKPKRTGGG